MQLILQARQAQASTSYTGNAAKHRQPVVLAAQEHAMRYTSSASTGNQLYTQRKHGQLVKQAAVAIHATQAQATSYTGSESTGKHYRVLSFGLRHASGKYAR